jgi:hypothetical protein
MKVQGSRLEVEPPQARLGTPYGKVWAFVIDSTRVYLMTGFRRPRLAVGRERVYVDFYLVRSDRDWRLDSYASFFDGRRGKVRADVREKIVSAITPEVTKWLTSLPREAIVSAEFSGFKHNKRATLTSEIPDLIDTFESNAQILEMAADKRCLAGANPAVYERMRDLAQRMRALVEPVKEFGRQVRATRFRPLEGRCENVA